MDTQEELLAYFTREIEELSGKEIDAYQQEMEQIRKNQEQELNQAAQEAATRWYEQEEEEERSNHAVKMSHLNDENHRKLMEERNALVDQLFAEVKEQIIAFHHSPAYIEKMQEKLQGLSTALFPATLYVGKEDEGHLEEWLRLLPQDCVGKVDTSIQLGGFRLEASAKGRIVDESFDQAIKEARDYFLQTSGLTIC